MNYIINLFPTEDDKLVIRRKLQEYNELMGGIVCTIVGQWLEIDFLWVRDDQRGKGLGKGLLFEAEKVGIENECTKVFLTTMNFQAQPFYSKYGYKTVYIQKGYPITNEKYFMEKTLIKY